jgi:hypothetical protein
MSADPDEDLVPSPDAIPPRPAARPTAPAPPAGGLAWGVAGFLHEAGDLTTQPGLRGVARFVNSDVTFTPPPLPHGWRPTPGTPGRFEMPWPGHPAQARTLKSLRADLDAAARTARLKDGTDPLLGELDAATNGLLALTEKLHAAGWTLGILQPENVALAPDTGEPRLLDLGFTWAGSYGPPPWDASPGKPDWLTAPRAEWLHSLPAVRRQFAEPNAGHFPPVERTEDVRTISRLIAWLLTGQPRADFTAPSRGANVTLWRTLADGAAGKLATVRELCERLAGEPPSEHFTDRPQVEILPDPIEKSPGSWTTVLAGLLAVGLLGIAVVGGLIYAFGPSKKPEVVGIDPPPPAVPPGEVPPEKPPEPVTSPADFAKNLAAFEAALKAKDLTAAGAALPGVYGPGPVTPADEASRRAARGKYVDLWVTEFKAAVTLAAQPARRLDALAKMRDLQAELKSNVDKYPLPPDAASLTEKEQQCLDFAARLASQLGS